MTSSVPLIPRKVLFGNPDKAAVRISPDGSKIGYLAAVDGVLNVWVGPLSDPDSAKPVTKDTVRGIRTFSWAYTSQHILYLQDIGGDENWRLYSVDLESGEIKDLTPFEGVQAQVLEVSPKFPDEILVGINNRVPELHDVFRIHLDTSERQLVEENAQGFAGYMTDDELNIRFGTLMTPDGGVELHKKSGEGWEPFLKIPSDDALTTNPIAFDKSGQVLYLMDSRGRNTSALFTLDLGTGEQILIAEDEKSDVNDVMIHPSEKNLLAVAFNYTRKEWRILDEGIKQDLDYLKSVADGDVEVVSWTLDASMWVVAYTMDNGPVRYYVYDRTSKKAAFLFTNRKALEGLKLSKMVPVVIPARDGLELVNYYTLPPEYEGKTHPEAPLPMVLLVHGGPWGRDVWGYDAFHQVMANRGYAVLSVNFRASDNFSRNAS